MKCLLHVICHGLLDNCAESFPEMAICGAILGFAGPVRLREILEKQVVEKFFTVPEKST